jgi:hypothetical protein
MGEGSVMKVRTFIAKSNLDGLSQCDGQINAWLEREKVEVLFVHQSSGTERHHGQNADPIVVTSIWYNESE